MMSRSCFTGAEPSPFSDAMSKSQLEALEDRAYASWELGEVEQAAELFFEAARLETQLAATRGPAAARDKTILFRARAAFCLWEAGAFEEARPILHEVARFDWKQGGLWADRHDSEKAYARLILEAAAQGDEAQFSALWAAATARAQQLDRVFPSIVPDQKKLLAAALALKRKDVCRHIVAALDPKWLAKHHDLQLLKVQAEALG